MATNSKKSRLSSSLPMEKKRIIQFSRPSLTNFYRKYGALVRSQPISVTTMSKSFSLQLTSMEVRELKILPMQSLAIIILRSLRIVIERYSTCMDDSVKMRFRILQTQVKRQLCFAPSKEMMLRINLSLQSQGHRASKTGTNISMKLQMRQRSFVDDVLLKSQLNILNCKMLMICDWKSSGSQLSVKLYLRVKPATTFNNAAQIASVISVSSLTCSNSQNQPSTKPIQPSNTSTANLSLLHRLASRNPTSISSLSNAQLPTLSQNQATKSQISGVRCVLGHSLSARRLRMILRHLMRSSASFLLLPRNPPMQFTKKVIISVYSSSASASSRHQILTFLLKLKPLSRDKFYWTFFPSSILEKTFRYECCSTSMSSPSNSFRFMAKYSSSSRCLISFLIELSLAVTECIIIIFYGGNFEMAYLIAAIAGKRYFIFNTINTFTCFRSYCLDPTRRSLL